jgi:hypothetical protein
VRTFSIQRNLSIGQAKEQTAICGHSAPKSQKIAGFKGATRASRLLGGLVMLAAVAIHVINAPASSPGALGAMNLDVARQAQLQRADIIDDIIDIIIETLGGTRP